MIPVAKWFEREFVFDIPIERFPNILERLRGTSVRLEEKTLTLLPETLVRRLNGSWSIQENIGHLLDLESLHMSRLLDLRNGSRLLTAADLKNQRTHNANHNAAPIQSLLQSFRMERSHFILMAEKLDGQTIAHSALHPRLQKLMNVIDLCYFMAEHDDQHLARITELLRLP